MSKNDKLKNQILSVYKKNLRDNYIKNMVQGFEVASMMYLEKIEKGCTIEELKEFITKNIKSKDVLEKIIKK